jgi:hypothetical protein
MLKIRKGVFETNSSSNHTLILMSDSQYDEFMAGELAYNRDRDEFLSIRQLQSEIDSYAESNNYEDLEDAIHDYLLDNITLCKRQEYDEIYKDYYFEHGLYNVDGTRVWVLYSDE